MADAELTGGEAGGGPLTPAIVQDADTNENVRITPGALEGSNVNLTDSLVNMIEISRQLEMQMKSLQTSDTNAQSANELLRHA